MGPVQAVCCGLAVLLLLLLLMLLLLLLLLNMKMMLLLLLKMMVLLLLHSISGPNICHATEPAPSPPTLRSLPSHCRRTQHNHRAHGLEASVPDSAQPPAAAASASQLRRLYLRREPICSASASCCSPSLRLCVIK